MKKLKCENGDVFGYWKIMDNTSIIKNGHTYVKAQCKCGKLQTLCLSDLVHKRTTGCRSCRAQDRKLPIKIGEVYKNWTVIGDYIINRQQCVMWKVQCNCCNITVRWIQGNELVDPNRCFCCQKCASKKMIRETTKKRGRLGDLTKTQYTRLQRSAENRNIEFNISIEYLWNLFVFQNSICAITGDSIKSIKKASLDRIDSELGYIEKNVQWTTKQANISKHIMSKKEFIIFCHKVLNYANQQPS